MNEMLWDYQLEVVDRELVNSNKEEKIGFGTAESFIRSLALLVFCSVIWSQNLPRITEPFGLEGALKILYFQTWTSKPWAPLFKFIPAMI